MTFLDYLGARRKKHVSYSQLDLFFSSWLPNSNAALSRNYWLRTVLRWTHSTAELPRCIHKLVSTQPIRPFCSHQVEGDPNFVTSIETAPARRRISPTPERRGRKRAPPSRSVGCRGHSSDEGWMSTPRWALGQDQTEEESTRVAVNADVHVHEGEDPWRRQKAKRGETSSNSTAPRADQADPATMDIWGGGSEKRGQESFGTNHGSSRGGGAWAEDRIAPVAQGGAGMPRQRGVLSEEWRGSSSSTYGRGGGVRGTGSSAPSRWHKFAR